MVIVYIRHGHDDEDLKFSEHEDDVELLRAGWELAQVRARRLVRYFGVPEVIRCSPFQRAVDTARAMSKWMEKNLEVKVPLEVDCSLSRLFSPEEQECPDLNPQTARCPIPIKEKWKDFCTRVAGHTETMRDQIGAYQPGRNIWCISHSIVLLEIAHYHHKEIRDPVEYLDWFDVTELPCQTCWDKARNMAFKTPKKSKSSKKKSK